MILLRRSAVAATAAAMLVTSSCHLFRRASDGDSEPAPTRRGTRAASSIASTDALLSAIRSRYRGNWYSTLSFVGENSRWSPAGQETSSRWAEYVSVPGKLRIEFLPWSNQSGVLFEDGQVHSGTLASFDW